MSDSTKCAISSTSKTSPETSLEDRRPLLVLLLRRRSFEPQVHVRTLCWSHGRARSTGRRARPQDRVARVRRERRCATERLRRLRPPRAARRRRPRARDPGEAQPRGSARARGRRGGSAAGRRAVRALPGLRRLPVPGPRVRGAARGEGGAGRRGASPDRSRRRPAARADRPGRVAVFHYRNKLEYSFTATPDGPALGFHRAGRWDEVLDIRKCWLTTDLGNAIREAVRDWARAQRLEAVRPGRAHRLPAPPRRPRGAKHRSGARPARHGSRHARRGQLRRRARALPRGAVDPLVGQRTARRGDEPPDAAPARCRRDRGGALRAAVPGAPERVSADEHGDGRAHLRARARVRGSDGRGERLRPLLRDRDDRAHCWPATR